MWKITEKTVTTEDGESLTSYWSHLRRMHR